MSWAKVFELWKEIIGEDLLSDPKIYEETTNTKKAADSQNKGSPAKEAFTSEIGATDRNK
ncbi:hypothetical protein IX51_06015 [uncultured archaeon]|nr:hypothetical protein IX51_06015 [uncultured archaeon]